MDHVSCCSNRLAPQRLETAMFWFFHRKNLPFNSFPLRCSQPFLHPLHFWFALLQFHHFTRLFDSPPTIKIKIIISHQLRKLTLYTIKLRDWWPIPTVKFPLPAQFHSDKPPNTIASYHQLDLLILVLNNILGLWWDFGWAMRRKYCLFLRAKFHCHLLPRMSPILVLRLVKPA